MTQWEYLYLYASLRGGGDRVTNINGQLVEDEGYELGAALDTLGRDGWELVGLTGIGDMGAIKMVMKRPLTEADG